MDMGAGPRKVSRTLGLAPSRATERGACHPEGQQVPRPEGPAPMATQAAGAASSRGPSVWSLRGASPAAPCRTEAQRLAGQWGCLGEGKHPILLPGAGRTGSEGCGGCRPFRSWCQLVSRRDGPPAGLRPGAGGQGQADPKPSGLRGRSSLPLASQSHCSPGHCMTAPGRSLPGARFLLHPPVGTHLKLEPRWDSCPLSITRACSPGSPG